MDSKDLLPLLGVLVGWGLNELSGRAAWRRENKETIGKVLSLVLLAHGKLRVSIELPELLELEELGRSGSDGYMDFDSDWWRQFREELNPKTSAYQLRPFA